MQPPKWLLVLGLGACVLSKAHGQHDSDLSETHDDHDSRAGADITLGDPDDVSVKLNAMPSSGESVAGQAITPRDLLKALSQEDTMILCDEDDCDCCLEEGVKIPNHKGKLVKNDCTAMFGIKRCNICPIYWRNCPERSPFLATTQELELPPTDDLPNTHELQEKTVKRSPDDLLEEQCNSEASEAMEVILQNYLDELVDNVNQKQPASSPCSQIVLYDITDDDRDVARSLSKLWHWPENKEPPDHLDSDAKYRGNHVNGITVLTKKHPLAMNTTLAINPSRRMEKVADFDNEMCVVNMLAAVVRPDEKSTTSTLKVTLSSEGIKDHTDVWACASGSRSKVSSQNSLAVLGKKPKDGVANIPPGASIGQVFSYDNRNQGIGVEGPMTVTATDPPGYSGIVTNHYPGIAPIEASLQVRIDTHRQPPTATATIAGFGSRTTMTAAVTSSNASPSKRALPQPDSKVIDEDADLADQDTNADGLNILKKKDCEFDMMLHPASKGQKCVETALLIDGGTTKVTWKATATDLPGWSAKVKDQNKHHITLRAEFNTDLQPPVVLITQSDKHYTATAVATIESPLVLARIAAKPPSKLQQRNHAYAGLPSLASSGEAFTTTVNIDGRAIEASGIITATDPTGFVATVVDDHTATATIYGELDEDEHPVMVRGSVFSDGMVATINEPWYPAGFTGIVNPGVFDLPERVKLREDPPRTFTPATVSPATQPTTTTRTVAPTASGSGQVITKTATITAFAVPSTITKPPITVTNTAMSLGDKIIPITGSSKQIVNNTIMTVVYPPRANLDPTACNRDRLLELDMALGRNTSSPEFTNMTIYKALHPEYNWNAIDHYANQVRPDVKKDHASQLAILCMRNGDQRFTSPMCPCNGQRALATEYISNGHTFRPTAGSGSVISTEINGQHVVFTIPSPPAMPLTPSGARATATVVRLGTAVLPYNPSSTYPSAVVTEVVFASSTSSHATATLSRSATTANTSSHRLNTVYVLNGHTFSLSQGPGRVVSTTINGTPLVFTAPSPATGSVTRATTTVVQVAPSVTLTEIVQLVNVTTTHYSTKTGALTSPTPTAKPSCKDSDRDCRISKCLWNHMKPINIATVMPALMDDPYDGHMMYDYFTQRTSLTGRPHWGTTDQNGLYYPFHVATHSSNGVYAVRETPALPRRKKTLFNSEPVVHPEPDCFDPNSCHTLCEDETDRHSRVKLLGGAIGGSLAGALLLLAGGGMLHRHRKRRRNRNSDPSSQGTTPQMLQAVDPVTGQPVVPVAGGDRLGTTTAVDPTTGGPGTKPALRGAGTLGRQAEEGRGRVHFGENQPGGGAEGAPSGLSGTGTDAGNGVGTGAVGNGATSGLDNSAAPGMGNSATTDAASAANPRTADEATQTATEAAPGTGAAEAATQPAEGASQVVEKTVSDGSGKMAQVPEESAEHVEAVAAHDGADSRRTGSELFDMGSLRGRRKMRANNNPFH